MYELQSVTTHLPDFLRNDDADRRRKARSQWWTAFEAMSDALRAAADKAFPGDTLEAQEKRRPYSCSVTETEIRNGIMAVRNGRQRKEDGNGVGSEGEGTWYRYSTYILCLSHVHCLHFLHLGPTLFTLIPTLSTFFYISYLHYVYSLPLVSHLH